MQDLRAGVFQEGHGAIRLLAGVVTGTEPPVTGGGHGGVAVTLSISNPEQFTSDESSPTISAYIHHFPFSLVLVDESVAGDFPHRDCTDWLRMGVNEAVEPFQLELPAVRVA